MIKFVGLFVGIGIITNIFIGGAEVDLYYYEEHDNKVELTKYKANISKSSYEKMIKDTLELLIANNSNKHTFIPNDVNVNMVILMEGELFIDFSKEILNYGGNTWEEGLVNQILAVLFQFEDISCITFLIDGKKENLVEGTIINSYTRIKWKERNVINGEN